MPTTKNRVTAPLKLFRGTDPDLIAWLDGIETGKRNSEVKRMLRRGIGLPEKKTPGAAELDELRSRLDTLQAAVGRVPEAIKKLAGDKPANTDYGQRLEEVERYLKELDGWLGGFDDRLSQITQALQSGAGIPLPVDDGLRLSDDQVEATERNLLKNDW